ncbi:MAG: hypothetical protein QOK15_3796 [Nocardioidaceae bacterium]|nr:hypothetical protein [Nocardioidaceae bacterium]
MSRTGITWVRGRLAAALVVTLTLAVASVSSSGADAAQTGAAVHARTAGGPQRDGRILYVNFGNGQLDTSNPDGTAVVQVTHTPDLFAQQPRWLPPNDSSIVFVGNRGGAFALYTVNADGTGQHRLFTDRPGFNAFTPAPTSDGRRVLFGRCRPDPPGGCGLFSVRLDGSGLRALTPYVRHGGDFWPSVAPGGHRVAFTRFGGHGINVQTWVMRLDGTHAHPITPPWLEAARPRWLPGGRSLLVTSFWAHQGENIYRMRADGSHRQRLTTTRFPHNSAAATPSPSGRRIAFADDRAYPDLAGIDLFVMRSDGSREHRISSGSFFDPDWGSAPLLPARASTPRRRLAPALSPRQRAAAVHQLERWLPAHG